MTTSKNNAKSFYSRDSFTIDQLSRDLFHYRLLEQRSMSLQFITAKIHITVVHYSKDPYHCCSLQQRSISLLFITAKIHITVVHHTKDPYHCCSLQHKSISLYSRSFEQRSRLCSLLEQRSVSPSIIRVEIHIVYRKEQDLTQDCIPERPKLKRAQKIQKGEMQSTQASMTAKEKEVTFAIRCLCPCRQKQHIRWQVRLMLKSIHYFFLKC